MENGYYLLSYKVNGVKNIDKDIRLEFYKKTIDEDFDSREYNVKAIYGENGTGKSAIITSVKALKNLMLNRYYLTDTKNRILFNNLFNKKTNVVSFEIEFVCRNDGMILVFRYYIEIKKDEIDGLYKISKEELDYRKTSAKKWTNVYSIDNGKVTDSIDMELFEELNKDNGIESLREKSFLSYFTYKYFRKEIDINSNASFISPIIITINLAFSLYIYIDYSDEYEDYLNYVLAYDYKNNPSKYNNKIPNVPRVSFSDERLNYVSHIEKEDFDAFSNDINNVYEFIKIFKPDLKKIEIEKKENNNIYVCELIFDYGEYKVNAAFESNGVKKLIKLYKAIEAVDKGSIVFIDEFDSNIHDVYLCKLIEYIEEYAKGQLCFTTQSITVMDVLEDRKKSLDFLTRDHEIISWFKNSHYSASKIYKNGSIKKSPFNIESFDFLKAFGDSVDEI